jgi:hypothetical protein
MPMNWIILILITLIVNILTFAICGFGGGFILLVALNGFSEADATSIFVIFTLMVFGISFFSFHSSLLGIFESASRRKNSPFLANSDNQRRRKYNHNSGSFILF